MRSSSNLMYYCKSEVPQYFSNYKSYEKMEFKIKFTPSSEQDLEYFKKHEQIRIISGIKRYLSEDANVETKRKKQLRPNELAPLELRIGDYSFL